VCGQRHAPAALPPGKRPGTHCIGGWMGPRAILDGWGKYRLHRDLISGPSSHLKILGARRVTRGKFHIENPQIFRHHRTKLSLPSCTPLPDGSLSATRSTHVTRCFTNVSLSCSPTVVLNHGLIRSFMLILTTTKEPVYNDNGLCDTPSIPSDILWYQLIPHC